MTENETSKSIYTLKTLQEAQVKLEEYLDIFNTLPVGIYRTKISDGTFLKVNPECSSMLGYDSPEELKAKAKSTDFYYSDEQRKKFIDLLEKTGSIRHHEMPLKTADGKTIWVAITARIHSNGSYLEGSLMDITESRRIAGELDRYKAEEAGRLCEINLAAQRRVKELDLVMCNGNAVHQDVL
ncbi:MAG: PAS domain S-box protein [Candidatus Thorarchaeota archaeon]|jgi:PAS domain S-box-containing protein